MPLRLTIIGPGRFRKGPLRALYDDYAQRVSGPGFGPLTLREIGGKQGPIGPTQEAAAIRRCLSPDSVRVALDEGGHHLNSVELAGQLQDWRDNGREEVAFLIGGADGLEEGLREAADLVLCLGRLTWPHLMVRMLMAEQLYRCGTILSGHPYHRA